MRPLPDLTSADLRVVSRWLDDDGSLRILREPSSADLIAVIRAGVESGTIKGVEHKGWLVIQVSDEGEDR